ncbi:hypothetical protein [Gracilimonas mengyeensis]|uniref:PEP-CTERM protein-sorting domain-containing protein n=1 Tax=Gracilimonas mengyeensis TaxID=1302730 RepID=A0A521C0Y1_9BACT|nr:hypothetical protein [Gracilimonas mengyeensis]SMO53122.1 PEP-CTERM protein-sorting domain-containing protein [Gracilimonas mengyeensis]
MKYLTSLRRNIRWVPAFLTTLTGFLLLTYMILTESEPGALPLLLILTGICWMYFRKRSHRSEIE